MKVKEFLKISLDKDMKAMKREIRIIKNQIKYVDDMKRSISNMKEGELLKLLADDPELLKQYQELKLQLDMKKSEQFRELVEENLGDIEEESNE